MRINNKEMKRPYLTEFERFLICAGTVNGSAIMLRFRWKQFLQALSKIKIIIRKK
ncbi:hypothetical protein LCGC14_1810540 [marine sediment metagenome]|uniref:Uncharacterized protein n=1 Tax=marine sediment metagenome TaxID=412755 RepID=A0A0F9H9Z2_9ZZZZ